jgi:iron complex transport system substrate-binding protein
VRVVSLLPSATEVVWALGRGDALVGRSQECDYPGAVLGLPIVMRARTLDSDRPSKEIDDRVREARTSGASLYELDVPLLTRLAPDVLLTQDLCGVCSVTEAEVHDACRSAGIDPVILASSPTTLSEVWDSVERIGEAIGSPEEGQRLAGRLRRGSVAVEGSDAPPRASMAVVEWADPPILSGLWTPDIIEAGGGIPIGPGSGETGHRTDWAAIRDLHPDLVVLAPCSFGVPRTRIELERLPSDSPARSLAPPLGFWLADEAYFSRPGPRLADGVRLLRALGSGARPTGPMPVSAWTSGGGG